MKKKAKRAQPRMPTIRTYALSRQQFITDKEKGDEGEIIVFRHFEECGYPNHRMPVPKVLSELPFQTEEQRQRFIRKFKKEVLIVDGYVKINGITYGVEAQWKSSPNFVVDVNKYGPLFELSEALAVRVYFYIKSKDAIYYHDVRDPRRGPPLETETQCGQRVYRIPEHELIKAPKVKNIILRAK